MPWNIAACAVKSESLKGLYAKVALGILFLKPFWLNQYHYIVSFDFYQAVGCHSCSANVFVHVSVLIYFRLYTAGYHIFVLHEYVMFVF